MFYLFIYIVFFLFVVVIVVFFFFGFYTERVSVERCFHTCFSSLFIYIVLFLIFLVSTWSELLLRGVSIYILVFVNLFIHLLIYLGAPWWSSFLVQLHVDGMQFYQQWNTLRLYRTAFCGGVYLAFVFAWNELHHGH